MAAKAKAAPPTTIAVRAHPPATSIKTGAGNGLGAFGDVLMVQAILWRGFTWRIAYDARARVLWVVTEDSGVVERNMLPLSMLATALAANDGNIKQVEAAEAATSADRFKLRGPKAHALDQLTWAVEHAIGAGASATEVRLAVYAGLGLDSDPSE